MKSENKFINQLQKGVEERGMMNDAHLLFRLERDKGGVATTLAILNLLPVDFGVINKISNFAEKEYDFNIELVRTRFSRNVLGLMRDMQPANFKDWKEARDYEYMLACFDGGLLASLSKGEREEYRNIRQKVRIQKESKAHTEGHRNQEAVLSILEEERIQLQEQHNLLNRYWQERKQSETRTYQSLISIDTKLKLSQKEARNDAQQMKSLFAKLGVELDEQTVLLLQSDKQIYEKVEVAITYLQEQEKRDFARAKLEKEREIENAQIQKREADYQGLMSGFTVLGAIGQVAHNSAIQKIALVGVTGVQIRMALGELTKLSGLAVINPYAMIVMSVLNMRAGLLQRGSDPSYILMKQLGQIACQIEELYKLMHEDLTYICFQLYHLEGMLLKYFQEIKYLITTPVTRRLDEIHSDLELLLERVTSSFRKQQLAPFKERIAWVGKIANGIVSKEVFKRTYIVKELIFLNHWLTNTAYDTSLTGMFVRKRETTRSDWANSPRQVYSELNRLPYSSVLPLLMDVVNQHGWAQYPNEMFPFPNTAVWYQALTAYLTLRREYLEELKEVYDKNFAEANELTQRAKQHLDMFLEFSYQPDALHGASIDLGEIFQKLIKQYSELKGSCVAKFRESTLGKHISDPFQPLGLIIRSQKINNDIPAKLNFKYQSGGNYDGSIKGGQCDFAIGYGFTPIKCVQLIATTVKEKEKKAKRKEESEKVELFSKLLLLAEKWRIIDFEFIMHRTMRDRSGKQSFRTSDGKYGLKTVVCIKKDRRCFDLTSPQACYADWPIAFKNKERALMNAHRNALPNITIINRKNIQDVNKIVYNILEDDLLKARMLFYRELADHLLKDDSLLYQLLQYLKVAQLISEFSQYKLTKINFNEIIAMLEMLIEICNKPENLDMDSIEKIHEKITEFAKLFSDAEIHLDIVSKDVNVSNQDLSLSFRQLLLFNEEASIDPSDDKRVPASNNFFSIFGNIMPNFSDIGKGKKPDDTESAGKSCSLM